MFSFTLPACAGADPVGSRQMLLGPPHRNENAPFRAVWMNARNGAVSDNRPFYNDPRNASRFAESVEFSAS